MKKLLARKEYEEYVRGLPEGKCPFCDISKQVLLGESQCWFWVANISPYWKYHTLLIPKRHESSMDNLTKEEFTDFQVFHKKVEAHMLGLGLTHHDGKSVDQFITMTRTRFGGVSGGSTYYKPDHLHIHLVPDREGVSRFVLDEEAINVDMQKIALRD